MATGSESRAARCRGIEGIEEPQARKTSMSKKRTTRKPNHKLPTGNEILSAVEAALQDDCPIGECHCDEAMEAEQSNHIRQRLASLAMNIDVQPILTTTGLFFRIMADGAVDTVRASEVPRKLAMLAECIGDCAKSFSKAYPEFSSTHQEAPW
jgi:hypothetical protein